MVAIKVCAVVVRAGWERAMHFSDLSLRNFETKSVSDDKATFSGVASTADIDHTADVIEPGAFGKSIGHVPLLREHNPNKIIGRINEFQQDGKNLRVEGEIGFDSDTARETYALMKRGYLTGMSPGYMVKRGGSEFDNNGVRHVKDAKLFEMSIVALPANGRARVRDVKSLLQQVGARDFLFDLGFDDDDVDVIVTKGFDALLRGEGKSSPSFLPSPLPPAAAEEIPAWAADVRNLLKDARQRYVD